MNKVMTSKIKELVERTESQSHYLDLLSAIDRNEPIQGLTEEEISILKEAYGDKSIDKSVGELFEKEND